MSYERDPRVGDMEAMTHVSRELMAQKPVGTIGTPEFDAFYRRHAKRDLNLVSFGNALRTSLTPDELAPHELDTGVYPTFKPELVTAAEVNSLTTAMLVESHIPVFSSLLTSNPSIRMDVEQADFSIVWSAQEFEHFRGDLMYLEALSAAKEMTGDPRIPLVDLDILSQKLAQARAGNYGDQETKYTPFQREAFLMLQELFTYHIYDLSSGKTAEPMLKTLYRLEGKDEMVHHQWYYDRTKEKLRPDPEQPEKMDPHALEELTEVLITLNMPGPTFVPDYAYNPDALKNVADPQAGIGKLLVSKMDQLIGKDNVNAILARKDFRDSLANRGIDSRKLFAYRLLRKLPFGG